MADYPTGIYSPRTKENKAGVVYDADKTTIVYAEDLNGSDDEIVAIETELGTEPKGSYDDVADRLDNLLDSNGDTLVGELLFGENSALRFDDALSADGKYCGVVEAGTAGDTLSFGDLCYLASRS